MMETKSGTPTVWSDHDDDGGDDEDDEEDDDEILLYVVHANTSISWSVTRLSFKDSESNELWRHYH